MQTLDSALSHVAGDTSQPLLEETIGAILGEMDADQLAETTMDPRHRTLRRVTLRDAEMAERVFELLMGNDVAPRKDFIVESAAELDRERIDA